MFSLMKKSHMNDQAVKNHKIKFTHTCNTHTVKKHKMLIYESF